jgi:GNAT superfamily N-acetyltransferase
VTWRAVHNDSPGQDRQLVAGLIVRHLHPIHLECMQAPWVLGDGHGIALVMPSVALWFDPAIANRRLASFATAEASGLSLTLSTCWIAPEHRRQGHFRELLRLLRGQYGDNLAVNTHILEMARASKSLGYPHTSTTTME